MTLTLPRTSTRFEIWIKVYYGLKHKSQKPLTDWKIRFKNFVGILGNLNRLTMKSQREMNSNWLQLFRRIFWSSVSFVNACFHPKLTRNSLAIPLDTSSSSSSWWLVHDLHLRVPFPVKKLNFPWQLFQFFPT